MASVTAKETNLYSFQVQTSTLRAPNPQQRKFFIAQVILRVLAIALTLASICVMITSRQTVNLLGTSLDVRYTYLTAFKFFVVANAVASAFSVLALIFVLIFGRPGLNPRNYFYIFLHDIVILSLVLSGCAAAAAVGYVGRYGQTKALWMSYCSLMGKFCNKILVSLILSFLAFLSLFAHAIMSAHKPLSELH